MAAADAIVRGRVDAVSFQPGQGSTPVAISTIRIIDRIKVGKLAAGSQTLSFLQTGGPVPQTVGGALAQLDTGELVLPGDEAILLLTSRPELAPHYQAVPAAGIYFVRPMGVVPEHSNAFGLSLNGQPVDLFVARVRALVR